MEIERTSFSELCKVDDVVREREMVYAEKRDGNFERN